MLQPTIVGLALLTGLFLAGGEAAYSYDAAAHSTAEFLARVAAAAPDQAEEAASLPEGASGGWWASV